MRIGALACRREGAVLVDLLSALLLGGLVAAVAGSLLRAQLRLGARVGAHAAVAEAERTAAVVLLHELRGLDPGRDLQGPTADTVGIRAFRGMGVVCTAAPSGAVVRFRGTRAPDLGKDSLVVIRTGAELVWTPAAVAAASHPCVGDEETGLRLVPVGPLAAGDLVLLFEKGSYHLADGALRYRRGGGGRQPLTGPLLQPGSGFGVQVGGDGAAAAVTAELRMATPGRAGSHALELRAALLNAGGP